MQPIKRIRYYTMNSWNLSTAPAYNLKVYNVISPRLKNAVYELMDSQDFFDPINQLVRDFNCQFDHQWQAGFNGRSGGYLVLYRGGKHKDGLPFSYPGKQIDDNEVPADVKKAFRQLAIDIVKTTEYMAKNYHVEDEKYTIEKTRKIIVEN